MHVWLVPHLAPCVRSMGGMKVGSARLFALAVVHGTLAQPPSSPGRLVLQGSGASAVWWSRSVLMGQLALLRAPEVLLHIAFPSRKTVRGVKPRKGFFGTLV